MGPGRRPSLRVRISVEALERGITPRSPPTNTPLLLRRPLRFRKGRSPRLSERSPKCSDRATVTLKTTTTNRVSPLETTRNFRRDLPFDSVTISKANVRVSAALASLLPTVRVPEEIIWNFPTIILARLWEKRRTLLVGLWIASRDGGPQLHLDKSPLEN